MARHRKIDESQALEAAMGVFWQRGFQGLSTRELESMTGITRFTLQESYGGKEGLFLLALGAYLDEMERSFFTTMHAGHLEDLAIWFDQMCDERLAPKLACYGCFMINSMIEFADTHPEIGKAQTRFFELLNSNFERVLQQAHATGELSTDVDVDAMVQVLTSASVGINVTNRAAGSLAAGEVMAKSIATLVRSWALQSG